MKAQDKPADTTASHQIELIIRQLDSLSTLPAVASRFFPKLLQPQFSPADIADIVESDPALTAIIFSLIADQQLSLDNEQPTVRAALQMLPGQLVRDAVLSVKVCGTFEAESGPGTYRALPRKQLALHLLATACCARDIAEIIEPPIDPQLAYSAALLHDIGKVAVDQAMPKSFDRVVKEAKSKNASICVAEQQHFGADHTILGKRLAQKWHLPNEIALAIWLHHSDTSLICETMPEARIAQVVQLADQIARQCNVGQSGSYDIPNSVNSIAQSLGLDAGSLQQIRKNLVDEVAEKSRLLGLDVPNVAATYNQAIHNTVCQLAQNNTKLSLENSRLQTDLNCLDFASDFLAGVSSATSALDIAEDFALRWQKFYQTGPVCLYLRPQGNSSVLEAIVVENPSQVRTVILEAPADSAAIPEELTTDFAIVNADDYVGWLFEQLDIDFAQARTKLVPLLSGGRAAGAIVFEFHQPIEVEKLTERFRAAASIGAIVLNMAFASQKQQHFAERFAGFLGQLRTPKRKEPVNGSATALTEMAAGAAHELNNPLSVISGRTQLLADGETDPEKKQILSQIQENAEQLAGIIDGLMNFAEPQPPRPARIDVRQLLEEAVELTVRKTKSPPAVRGNVAEDCKDIFVDSAQIVSAIANVIANAVESYSNGTGIVDVTAETADAGDFVELQITDSGCGMDAETLAKATQPFFSAKPAGRKRGMGLAHASRLIQLNNGSLNIASEPGSGTTVTITLPCKG